MRAFQSLVLAAVASPLWLSIAAAQEPGVHLVWERPVGSLCPTRAALEADVEEIMGRSIFTRAETARVTLRGTITARGDEVRVRIEARSASGVLFGTRELTAPAEECAQLRAPIVLVLTLFVEEDGGAGSATGAWARFGFGASGTVVSVPLPRAALALGPALSLELGGLLRLQLDASYWLPVTIETRRGVGAKLRAWSGALRVCLRLWGSGAFALRSCLGGELGALLASPLQLEGPEQQARLLAHGFLELRGETQLGDSVRIDAAVGPVLSLSRPSFSYLRTDGASVPLYRPNLGGIIFALTFIILGS